MGVVPAFDEIEDRPPGLVVRTQRRPVEELALERGEEALGHRVVVAVTDGPHRGSDAAVTAALAESNRGVLRALVRVMDHRMWAPIGNGLLERVVDQHFT